jgi:two-component system, OmpR family, sensor kinase
MSHRRASRVGALTRRLLQAQLRIKVMAGVVVVTLVALVAFDLGAVATMRRYLLAQTDSNLQGALTLTVPQLANIMAHVRSPGSGQGRRAVPSLYPPGSFNTKIPALAGAYDMVFLPFRGKQTTLQVAANGGGFGVNWTLSRRAAQVAIKPGPHVLAGPAGQTGIRVLSLSVPGGSLVAGTSLGQVDETIVQVELIVIWGSIAVVLLIGFGVFVVLRRGLRPIEAMAAQADRITAGDLTDRVTAHHPGSEVGRLGTALNGMLARIEADVHEREASQQQMRRFFADASHELRTPLASLRANAELYQQGALRSRDEVDEVMDRIVLETRRMGRLVDDMLRLARLGQHPGQSREPVDLTAVVTGCAERVWIADPGRTWQVRIAGGLATVGDEELLRRAVDNLLMNVLVHTPGHTVGTIAAREDAGHVVIEVSDDGPGVPPDKLPHIFERFYRAGARPQLYSPGQPAPTYLPAGSGLGLAIAAEIASAHGGAACAAPAVPHGLRITLTVPAPERPGRRPARELAAAAT